MAEFKKKLIVYTSGNSIENSIENSSGNSIENSIENSSGTSIENKSFSSASIMQTPLNKSHISSDSKIAAWVSNNQIHVPQSPSNQEELAPEPLSDDAVNAILIKMGKLNPKDINYICDTFAQCINKLLKTILFTLDSYNDEDDIVEIDRLKRIIGLCPKDELFIRSKDKLWHTRYHIMEKNENWFFSYDYSKNIKKDFKQSMIETLIKLIMRKWKELTTDEKNKYWVEIIKMLQLVAMFKKLISNV